MLNENLRRLRKQKGFTQDEIASQLHVVRQTVSKWEKGISVPDADILVRLADIYEVDVSDLLGPVSVADSKENAVEQELAAIHRQILIHNRRVKTWLYILAAVGIGIVLWGITGIRFGVVNYSAVVKDPAYSSETAQMVLSGCISIFVKGIFRVVIGTGIVTASCLLNKKYKE